MCDRIGKEPQESYSHRVFLRLKEKIYKMVCDLIVSLINDLACLTNHNKQIIKWFNDVCHMLFAFHQFAQLIG